MRGKNSKRSCALSARGFAALGALLVLLVAFGARPAEAAPFAYVANFVDNTVSVIDTATNPPTVVATIPVGIEPTWVAVTPDGKHAYVTNTNTLTGAGNGTVSVIDTATNKVVGPPITVGTKPLGVAVTPDGKHAYVANNAGGSLRSTVSVIDTATNTVVATVRVDGAGSVAITPDGKHAYVTGGPVSVIDTATNTVVATVTLIPLPSVLSEVAITPDGKHAYVTDEGSDTVLVIDTATNTVVATIALGISPFGVNTMAVALTPDGKHAYVTNPTGGPPTPISVIDTASNTVVATVTVGPNSEGIAITPDGKHAYVANQESRNVSVIDTATNTVMTTVGVGLGPEQVGIIPGFPFSSFSAELAIDLDHKPNRDAFGLLASFTLGSTTSGIDPVAQPVTLQIGSFATTIPPGSFTQSPLGTFTFLGTINGVNLEVVILPTGGKQFALEAAALNANLSGTANPVTVRLSVGNNSGTTSVNALIF